MDFQELKLNLQDLLNRVNEIRDNVFKIETKENSSKKSPTNPQHNIVVFL